jgi:uncharacterized protein (TIGR03118 family)
MKLRLLVVSSVAALASAFPAAAQFYDQHDLVSDHLVEAQPPDPNLVNPWGLVASPTSPWWAANNGTATATLYTQTGSKVALTVELTRPPTGIVFNGGAGFVVSNGTASGPARFIFATEDGAIIGWPNATVGPVVAADRASVGAVYKGLAIATSAAGTFLYATDFHNNRVDVFDASFHLVSVAGAFVDRKLPHRYAPFGTQAIGSTIYVTYAKQDKAAHDDLAGKHRGFVDAYDTAGNLIRRVASRGDLDSPWGIALAPANFGTFSGDLLIGNFGNGRVTAFDLAAAEKDGEAAEKGQMRAPDCSTLSIDGLWSLQFGTGSPNSGPTNTLFFTAGPDEESHGLFGNLTAAAAPNCPKKVDDD